MTDTIDLEHLCRTRFPRIRAGVGVECLEGWNVLLTELCRNLSSVLESSREGRVEVRQVKEKFGTLRFYYDGEGLTARQARRVSAIVCRAEDLSGWICERCGAPGRRVVANHWVRTVCEEHTAPTDVVGETSLDMGSRSRTISRRKFLTEDLRFDPQAGRVVAERRRVGKNLGRELSRKPRKIPVLTGVESHLRISGGPAGLAISFR